MYQIDNATASSTLPAPSSSGTAGYFTDGNPVTGLAPTVVPAEFLNMLMMELVNLLQAAAIAPSKADRTQVAAAVKALAQKAQIQPISASVASNALTLSYQGGQLDFRAASLQSGAPTQSVSVPASSIVVPSGATLGMVSGQAGRIVLLEAYNGGSPVLCVANLSGGLQLDESNLISPTIISAGATSASVIYSASAVSASSPYRVVGCVDISENTAGIWVSPPTLVQGVGGQALSALGSLGFGQTHQSVTRVPGTTYYNTTGKPITISYYWSAPSQVQADVRVNGVIVDSSSNVGATNFGTARAIIPPNASYSISGPGITIGAAYELR